MGRQFFSFGQFTFLFLAIKLGMQAGLAPLVAAGGKTALEPIAGVLIGTLGMFMLATAGIMLTTMMLTLAVALSWGLGNRKVPAMSLVVWSTLLPVLPFFTCSWPYSREKTPSLFSLMHISLQTVLALIYLAFIATIVGYAIWGKRLSRYETWHVAPLLLLVPVIGILSTALVLGERAVGVEDAGRDGDYFWPTDQRL